MGPPRTRLTLVPEASTTASPNPVAAAAPDGSPPRGDARSESGGEGRDLERVVAGDASAWGSIVARHGPSVRRLCSAFASFDAADVDDATQETFVLAFERLPTLRDVRAFPAWLLAIARSVCLRRLRREAGAARVAEAYEADPAAGALAPRVDDLPDTYRVRLARELIEGLPPGPERETVRLFYVEGVLTAREIAEKMGVSKSAVTMRLERFRAKVKRRLLAIAARETGE